MAGRIDHETYRRLKALGLIKEERPAHTKPAKRGARIRSGADQIKADDRLGISTEAIEAAVRGMPTQTAPKFRSKLEGRYAQQLLARVSCGEVTRWWYEPVSLRLPGGHWYTPDFAVELADGRLEWIETKGYLWKVDALKIDVFRETWRGLDYHVVTHSSGEGWRRD